MTDIQTKLLAAFQVEHIEHLEAIRACVSRWTAEGETVEIDDAFRRAHSLKGAARITGLAPVETLSHRLESLFALMRSGELQPGPQVLKVVQAALDAIEDSAACLMQNQPAADSAKIVAELDGLMNSGSETVPEDKSVALKSPPAAAQAPSAQSPTRQQKLRAAFLEEFPVHLDEIRRLLTTAEADESPVDADEAFRCANSLRGAARLAQMPAVETLAKRLEALFLAIRKKELPLDAQAIAAVRKGAAAIEQAARNDQLTPESSLIADAAQALDQLSEPAPTATEVPPPVESAAPAPKESRTGLRAGVETVRLRADSLDRLLQSTGQMLTENLQQESLARELGDIGQGLSAVEREWDALKRTAAGPLRRLGESQELAGLAKYLDFVEHEIAGLARRVRGTRLQQQRSAWSVRLLAEQLQEDVRRTRMVPVESEFQGFRKMMRDQAHDEGKEIDFQVNGLEVLADRMVLQALKDPLMHVLRNALAHGIESPDERRERRKNPSGVVSLKIQAAGNRLTIAVDDDGRGVDLAAVAQVAVRRGMLSEAEVSSRSPQDLARLLFQPGFTTSNTVTKLSGRGMGLSAVYEAVTRLQGEVDLRLKRGGGTSLLIAVPLSISTHRLLLVSCGEQRFAIPLYGIVALHRVKVRDVESVEGRPMVTLDGHLVPLASLDHLLEPTRAEEGMEAETLQLVLLRSGTKRLAVAVDVFLAERNSIIKPLGPLADSLAAYAGGVLLEDGTVSLVVNPSELVDRFKPSHQSTIFRHGKAKEEWRPPTILVVDDSFTTRTLETSILETNGYTVRVAVDGIEALERLRSEKIDLVVTDVQMPRLDGFGLLEAIKADARLAHLPVIVVTSVDRSEDQQRGLDLGADAYIVKQKFDHQVLLKTIQQIL